MNVTKAIRMALALSAAAVAQVSCADLLYFQVSNPQLDANLAGTSGSVPFTYATVTAKDKNGGSTPLNLYVGSAKQSETEVYAYDLDATTFLGSNTEATYVGEFDSDEVNSFLVELWNWEDDSAPAVRVGWRNYSLSALDGVGSIWRDGAGSTGGNTPFTVTSVVPEPTSGLLLLLGAAGLALRRRRRA